MRFIGRLIGRLIVFGTLTTIVLGIALGVFAYFYLKSIEIPDDAHWAVQLYYIGEDNVKIPTRYYYAESVELQEGNVVLLKYWTYDGERYIKHYEEKIIEPPFEIKRRE